MPAAATELDARTLPLPQLLSRIEIASPCDANWDEMTGDDRRRHCAQCDLHVHNLEAMTDREVRDLLLNAEGRICGRIRRRTDGTILTRDCPVGLARLRRAAVRGGLRMAAMVAFVVLSMFWFMRTAVALNNESLRAQHHDLWPRLRIWFGLDSGAASPPIAGGLMVPPEIMGEIVPPVEDELMGRIMMPPQPICPPSNERTSSQ